LSAYHSARSSVSANCIAILPQAPGTSSHDVIQAGEPMTVSESRRSNRTGCRLAEAILA